MLCPKCKGIQDVIKIHDEKDLSKSRLCDVQCLNCGYVIYYQPYDYGKKFNLVINEKLNSEE